MKRVVARGVRVDPLVEGSASAFRVARRLRRARARRRRLAIASASVARRAAASAAASAAAAAAAARRRDAHRLNLLCLVVVGEPLRLVTHRRRAGRHLERRVRERGGVGRRLAMPASSASLGAGEPDHEDAPPNVLEEYA